MAEIMSNLVKIFLREDQVPEGEQVDPSPAPTDGQKEESAAATNESEPMKEQETEAQSEETPSEPEAVISQPDTDETPLPRAAEDNNPSLEEVSEESQESSGCTESNASAPEQPEGSTLDAAPRAMPPIAALPIQNPEPVPANLFGEDTLPKGAKPSSDDAEEQPEADAPETSDFEAIREALSTIQRRLDSLQTEPASSGSGLMQSLGAGGHSFVAEAMKVADDHAGILPRSFDLESFQSEATLLQELGTISEQLCGLCKQASSMDAEVGNRAFARSLEVYQAARMSGLAQQMDARLREPLEG